MQCAEVSIQLNATLFIVHPAANRSSHRTVGQISSRQLEAETNRNVGIRRWSADMTPVEQVGGRSKRRKDTIPKASLRSVSQRGKTSNFVLMLSLFCSTSVAVLSSCYPTSIQTLSTGYLHLIAFLSTRIVTGFYERRDASGVGLDFVGYGPSKNVRQVTISK